MFGSSRSRSASERTAQERERAREERERQRAQRAAGSIEQPAPSQDLQSSLEPEQVIDPVSAPAESDPVEAPVPVEPAQVVEPPPLDPVEPDAAVASTSIDPVEPEPPEGELPPAFASTAEAPLIEQPVHDMMLIEPAVESTDAPPAAAGAAEELPADGPSAADLAAEELLLEDAAIDLDPIEIPVPVKLPPPPGRPERIPPLPDGKRRRGRRNDPLLERRASRLQAHRSSAREAHGPITRARVGALIVLLVVIAVAWFLFALFQPGANAGKGNVIVSIPKGSSSSKIGTILAHEGVVSSAFFFEARALVEGKRGDLHSGRFQLRHDMSYAAAIAALSKPPPKVIVVKVVIPEGETRAQIAEIAHNQGLSGSYLLAAKRSTRLNPTHYGAPSATPNLEGFLFPATYELHAGAPAIELVAQQLVAFRQHFGSTQIHAAAGLHLTPYELLTVASMIEREAEVPGDRPLVAAVIYNRLRLGMTLGIDATLRYALHDYSEPLTEAQLQLNSPYNTRLHTGLPPTPISNPGAASMQAATHPAHVSYLYYVAAADGCGRQVFSTNYAQFQQNAAAYQRAIANNHGRVPTCKKK